MGHAGHWRPALAPLFPGITVLALTDSDRQLLRRCLDRDPEAWKEFVERFLPVIYHAAHHTAHMQGVSLQSDDVEDLAADVFGEIVKDDYKVLREFRAHASLATYLAVIARRVIFRRLSKSKRHRRNAQSLGRHSGQEIADPRSYPGSQLEIEEEVRELLKELSGQEADLVRNFYLEHKTYRQISEDLGIPENSIGPMLARVRVRLRNATGA